MKQIRKLDDGSMLIDLGNKWFRVKPSGQVIVREAKNIPGSLVGSVQSRTPTKKELAFVEAEMGRGT